MAELTKIERLNQVIENRISSQGESHQRKVENLDKTIALLEEQIEAKQQLIESAQQLGGSSALDRWAVASQTANDEIIPTNKIKTFHTSNIISKYFKCRSKQAECYSSKVERNLRLVIMLQPNSKDYEMKDNAATKWEWSKYPVEPPTHRFGVGECLVQWTYFEEDAYDYQ